MHLQRLYFNWCCHAKIFSIFPTYYCLFCIACQQIVFLRLSTCRWMLGIRVMRYTPLDPCVLFRVVGCISNRNSWATFHFVTSLPYKLHRTIHFYRKRAADTIVQITITFLQLWNPSLLYEEGRQWQPVRAIPRILEAGEQSRGSHASRVT